MNVKLVKLDHRVAQQVLASALYYTGAIDGDIGPATMKAVERLLVNNEIPHKGWSKARQVVGAVQRILEAQGYEPGFIDGLMGHNTNEAITAWLSDQSGTSSGVDRDKPSPILTPGRLWTSTEQRRYPTQADVPLFYGIAGNALCTSGTCTLPFAFPLAWDLSSKINSFRCHEKVAAPMTRVFAEAAKHYGEKEYRRLRLDMFGGCYNYRNMRGGSSISMHAYGIAVDLDPERNQLRWDSKRAAFAKEEYIPFWNIVVQCGGTPAGYAWDGDWMHAQWARLK